MDLEWIWGGFGIDFKKIWRQILCCSLAVSSPFTCSYEVIVISFFEYHNLLVSSDVR